MKKLYGINLDKELVDKVNKKIDIYGGKLSTLINKLLEDFLKNGRTNN